MAVCGFWRYKGGITWEEIRSSRNSGVMRVWRYNGGRYIEGELYMSYNPKKYWCYASLAYNRGRYIEGELYFYQLCLHVCLTLN